MRTELDERDGKIIWQAHLLSGEYLPEKVVGREEQKRKLHMCLSPMKNGQAPLNAWLYGPAGTGKTALARSLVNEVSTDSANRFGFYVNCWERRSLYSVVQAIAESMKLLRADAQDTNVKLDRIRQVIKEKPLVVILDDIDRVAPSERERIIYRILGLPHTGVVCIANKKETLPSLEERTRSRLGPIVIAFPRYTPEELAEILLERAKKGLLANTWKKKDLLQIAQASAGDARAGVEVLRHAAVAAESTGKKRIAFRESAEALRTRVQTRHQEMVSRLSYHERLIYELALEKQPLLTTDLQRIYTSRCLKNGITPVARRTFSKYVKLLGDAGLIRVDERSIGGKGRVVRAAAT